jgi:hypothetical protein
MTATRSVRKLVRYVIIIHHVVTQGVESIGVVLGVHEIKCFGFQVIPYKND